MSGSPVFCTCTCHANSDTASLSRSTSKLLAEAATFSSSNSIAYFDQEIERHFQAMRALQNRRNTLLPVSKLPSEVLCRIFEHLAPNNSSYEWDLRWIKFSHVSRHWRGTALGCASLWRCIPTTGPTELTREFLRRSKSAPLAVVVPYPRRRNTSFRMADPPGGVPLAFEELDRIATLNFTASKSCDLDFLSVYHEASAPMLTTLRIVGNDSPASRTLSLDPIFLAGAVGLRTLETRGIGLKWPLYLPSTLRKLTLTKGPLPSSRPTRSQLHELLGSLDCLEYLSLQDMLPTTNTDSRSVIQPLSLKDLSWLEIIDAVERCAAFLQHIIIPEASSLSIQNSGYYMDDSNDESDAVVSATVIGQHHTTRKSRRNSGLLVAVRFTLDPLRLYFRETWFENSLATTTAPIHNKEDSKYHIGLSLNVGELALQVQTKMMFDALLWDDIHRLEVAGIWELSVAAIQSMSIPMTRVDTVHASDCAAIGFLKALYQSKVADRPAEQADLFPALRVLILNQISLGATDESSIGVPENGEILLGILSAGRSGIRKVVLRSCLKVPPALFAIPDVEVTEEVVDDLEECVSAIARLFCAQRMFIAMEPFRLSRLFN